MSDILDPWGGSSSGGSDLIDPWDKAVAQQQASVLATEELPSTPQSGGPTPVIDADLRPRAPTQQAPVPPPAPVASMQGSTPLSTYLVLGGIVGVLGFLLWKYTKKDSGGSVEGLDEVEGLGDLEDFVQYALPITEKEYVVVEEISKSKKGTRVRFPESGAEIWADIQDLMSESEAKKQGLEERT